MVLDLSASLFHSSCWNFAISVLFLYPEAKKFKEFESEKPKNLDSVKGFMSSPISHVPFYDF